MAEDTRVEFTYEELMNSVPDLVWRRALDLHDTRQVLNVVAKADGTITSRVQGTEPRPYHQTIRVQRQGNRVVYRGTCSCPVSFDCKHVIAALIHLVHEQDPDGQVQSAAAVPEVIPLNENLEEWLTELTRTARPGASNDFPADINQRLHYVLSIKMRQRKHPTVCVELMSVRLLKDGTFSEKPTLYRNQSIYNGQFAKYIRPIDMDILRDIGRSDRRNQFGEGTCALDGREGVLLMDAILGTGRCVWGTYDGPSLASGPSRQAQPRWRIDEQGVQTFELEITGGGMALPMSPGAYVDVEQGFVGPIETVVPDRILRSLLSCPPVPPDQAEALRNRLKLSLGGDGSLLPQSFGVAELVQVEPKPKLNLYRLDVKRRVFYRNSDAAGSTTLAAAKVSFLYGDREVHPQSQERQVSRLIDGQLVVESRNLGSETRAIETLRDVGVRYVAPLSALYELPRASEDDYVLYTQRGPSDWVPATLEAAVAFSHRVVPKLRSDGWIVTMEDGFPVVLDEPQDWHLEVRDTSEIDWFDLSMGVQVNGQRVDLLPVLVSILSGPMGRTREQIQKIPEDHFFYGMLEDGSLFPMPAARIKPMLVALLDLYEQSGLYPGSKLKLSRLQVAKISEVTEGDQSFQWFGPDRLRALGRQLRNFGGLETVPIPETFHGALRPYQDDGVAWLQFLREHQLSGVLADDMGLGKTVQALAHLCVEKEAGRLDQPCLVIAPTSLMANWRLEAARFAPHLKVVTLHGPHRRQRFDEIEKSDLVLTTYPLLSRDQEELVRHDYHLILLDEAQNIKNPKAINTQVVRRLRGRHRLCMTGTPMENHLGELWSLFHFLMPGLLGDAHQFRRVFRTPIEKGNDPERRALLAKQLKPFMLRRTKEQVVSELPPKTEIVEHVELGEAQRDLYETIRLAMHDRVRTEIASRGLARSQIVILDALLKLRQACCDPRLLRLESAQAVRESAKLERLKEMLGEMVDENRRILLFSQFTSMLDLIQSEIQDMGVDFVRLTGDTVDRQTPIEQFQSGRVPIFLISLKAGGVGLNLTAADTVIHFDPWWNPAVEDQATDRAHRIGQTKAVFVYKLIALGTLEEKIVDLQARKAELAAGLFDESGGQGLKLSESDLDWLFAPLEDNR